MPQKKSLFFGVEKELVMVRGGGGLGTGMRPERRISLVRRGGAEWVIQYGIDGLGSGKTDDVVLGRRAGLVGEKRETEQRSLSVDFWF